MDVLSHPLKWRWCIIYGKQKRIGFLTFWGHQQLYLHLFIDFTYYSLYISVYVDLHIWHVTNMHKISTIWFYCKCMYACRKIWNYNSKNDSRPAYKRKPPHSDSKQAQALGPLQQESGKGVLREKDWTWRLESYVTYFLCHNLNFISFPLVSIFTFESTIF